jgi:hypothetical protein
MSKIVLEVPEYTALLLKELDAIAKKSPEAMRKALVRHLDLIQADHAMGIAGAEQELAETELAVAILKLGVPFSAKADVDVVGVAANAVASVATVKKTLTDKVQSSMQRSKSHKEIQMNLKETLGSVEAKTVKAKPTVRADFDE